MWKAKSLLMLLSCCFLLVGAPEKDMFRKAAGKEVELLLSTGNTLSGRVLQTRPEILVLRKNQRMFVVAKKYVVQVSWQSNKKDLKFQVDYKSIFGGLGEREKNVIVYTNRSKLIGSIWESNITHTVLVNEGTYVLLNNSNIVYYEFGPQVYVDKSTSKGAVNEK